MAYLQKKPKSAFIARWYDHTGARIEKTTGEFINQIKAQKIANKMEAEHCFNEQVPHFQTYAKLGFSPRYCFELFIHSGNIRFTQFMDWINLAGIEFAKPSQWRDVRKKGNGKRYRYKGRMLTIRELVQQPGCAVKFSTIRARLNKGMSAADAINTPPIDPRVSGARGAAKTNSRRK